MYYAPLFYLQVSGLWRDGQRVCWGLFPVWQRSAGTGQDGARCAGKRPGRRWVGFCFMYLLFIVFDKCETFTDLVDTAGVTNTSKTCVESNMTLHTLTVFFFIFKNKVEQSCACLVELLPPTHCRSPVDNSIAFLASGLTLHCNLNIFHWCLLLDLGHLLVLADSWLVCLLTLLSKAAWCQLAQC